MKYNVTIVSLGVLLSLSGCVNPFSPNFSIGSKIHKYKKQAIVNKQKDTTSHDIIDEKKYKMFHKKMTQVAKSTLKNKHYDRMTLATKEKKEWFSNLMYQLWDRQITRRQFIEEGLTQYPTHRYEFEFIANGFQNT